MPLQQPPIRLSDADPERDAREKLCREARREFTFSETLAKCMMVIIVGAALAAIGLSLWHG